MRNSAIKTVCKSGAKSEFLNLVPVPEGGAITYFPDETAPADLRRLLGAKFSVVGESDFSVLAVVGAGGREAARKAEKAAKKRGLPCVLLACELGYSGYGEGGGDVTVAFDPSLYGGDDAARGYGAAVAAFECLFEREARELVFGESENGNEIAAAKRAILRLFKRESEGGGTVAIAEGLSEIIGVFGGERFLGCEGAAAVARGIKRGKTEEENAAFLALDALKAYKIVAGLVKPRIFVPNVNGLIDFAAFSLGLTTADVVRARKKKTCDEAAVAYRLKEYGAEVRASLDGYIKVVEFASRRFKRLYKDRGFSYNGYMSAADKRLCFALAPTLGERLTLFDYAERCGFTSGLLGRDYAGV